MRTKTHILSTKGFLYNLGFFSVCFFSSLANARLLEEQHGKETPFAGSDDGLVATTGRELLDHHWGYFIRGVVVRKPPRRVTVAGDADGAIAVGGDGGDATSDVDAGFGGDGGSAIAIGDVSNVTISSPAPPSPVLTTTSGVSLGSSSGNMGELIVAQRLIDAGVDYEVTPEGIFFEELPPGLSIGPLPPGVSLEQFEVNEPEATSSMRAEEAATA